MACQMAWGASHYEDLLAFLTPELRPAGELERMFGPTFEPTLAYRSLQAAGPEAAPANPQKAADHAPPQELGMLIDYLDEEVAEKELRAMAAEFSSGKSAHSRSIVTSHGMEGQEAVDTYVSELVAALRDFPYDRLSAGREAGAWVRDEVVAPMFKAHWDFYSNQKRGMGFDLPSLVHLLCGENMLLARLRWARLAANL